MIEGPARGKVRVSAGMMKLWVDVADLRALKDAPAPARREAEVSRAHAKARPSVRTSDNTLDVRGLRADDAVALAEAFLDRMYGDAEPCAFIVHGVGSGALREAHSRATFRATPPTSTAFARRTKTKAGLKSPWSRSSEP